MKKVPSAVFQFFLAFTCLLPLVIRTAPAQDLQAQLDNLKNIIPPSPTASSLGKYADWPVNLYTGLANIDIPLYELKGRSINVPISLSYHASGIKVGEVSSWVGTGWTLNAGGVITRTVRGLPDEYDPTGYFMERQQYNNPDDLASRAGLPESVWKRHIVQSANGEADSEPDLYMFNAMGRSYKFFFRGDGVIFTAPYSNIKITTDFPNTPWNPNTWNVLLEDGTRLTFGGKATHLEKTTNPRFGRTVDINSFTSSWYLATITSNTGETVHFEYTGSVVKQDTYFSQQDYISYNINGHNGYCGNISESVSDRPKAESQQVFELYVSSIETDLGKVEFFPATEARLDLEGGKVLAQMKVYSKWKAAYIAQFDFHTSYSEAISSGEYITTGGSHFRHRLKLDYIERKSLVSEESQKWQFEYNPDKLPSRRSYAQDHWGYFNGAIENNTLLPPIQINIPERNGFPSASTTGFFPPNHKTGGNREGDGTAMQAEVLTRITYPTGGSSSFHYQPNSIPVTEERFEETPLRLDISSTQDPFPFSQTVPFTITKGQSIFVNFSFLFSYAYLADFGNNTVLGTVTILDAQGNQVWFQGVRRSAFSSSNNGFEDSQYINLKDPGNYTFRLNSLGDYNDRDDIYLTASLRYARSLGVQTFNKPVGGLRIEKIIDFDALHPDKNKTRRFEYASPFVISPVDPVNDYLTILEQTVHGGTTSNGIMYPDCYYRSITRNSSTKFALGTIQGGTVGYGQVTTLHGLNGENGRTVTVFSEAEDEETEQAKIFPYPPASSRDWRRGLVSIQTELTADLKPVKQIENTYAFDRKAFISGFKAGYSRAHTYSNTSGCLDVYGYCDIAHIYYSIVSEQVKKTVTVETNFSNAGAENLVITTNYYYDNPGHTQPTRTETTRSDQSIRVTSLVNYPLDYPAGTPFIDRLVENNMVSLPVEHVTYHQKLNGEGTEILSGMILHYRPDGLSLKEKVSVLETQQPIPLGNFKFSNAPPGLLPFNIGKTAFAADDDFVDRLFYDRYDGRNNLIQYHKVQDVNAALLWDYQQNYPVAEVKNAAADQVYHTSFEEDGEENGVARTGRKVHTGNVVIPPDKRPVAGTYLLSYWERVNGAWQPAERTIEYTPSDAALITTANAVDEVRMHPVNAQMITIAYDPLIGVISQTGTDGVTVSYFYDDLLRLWYVKDQEGNVVKRYQYHYMAAPELPQVDRTPRWEDVTGSSVCLTAPYGNTGQQQVTQRDENPDSETFGTTKQVVRNNPGACPPTQSAYWVDLDPQQYPYVCEVNSFYGNTGYQLKAQQDTNPNSPTYNQIQRVRGPYDAVGNICKRCGTVDNEKWIPPQPGGAEGFCETSYEKVTVEACRFDSAQGGYVTGFAYKFSDGTLGATFYVVGTSGCVEF